MSEQFANYAESVLAAAINASQTVIPVASALTFSQVGTFRLVVDTGLNREIMAVSSVSGDNLTVVRGTEGTTAVPHSAGAAVVQTVTAAALYAIENGGGITIPVPVTEGGSGANLGATGGMIYVWAQLTVGGNVTPINSIDCGTW